MAERRRFVILADKDLAAVHGHMQFPVLVVEDAQRVAAARFAVPPVEDRVAQLAIPLEQAEVVLERQLEVRQFRRPEKVSVAVDENAIGGLVGQDPAVPVRIGRVLLDVKADGAVPVVADTAQAWMREALADVLPGAHNVANACIAYAVAERFGVTREKAAAALRDFALPGARWRKVEKWGATFIDDTYNANPDSMIAALNAFVATPCDGKRIAVLGDMFELGDDAAALHRKVFDHARALGIPLVIGVGEQSSQCLCNLAYKELSGLRKKFRVDVSAGDLVLLKASHSMKLGSLLDD